jgi:hypothetical protein
MNEIKSPELAPPEPNKSIGGGLDPTPLRKVCVKLYLNEKEFNEWIVLAENAGIRPRGLKPFTKKEHGFAWERIANTKGLVKFVKLKLLPYWVDGEAERKERQARVLEEAQKLGLIFQKNKPLII